MSLAAQQALAGGATQTPVAIYDFSDAAYLKAAVTQWASCAGPAPAAAVAQSINLETLAAAAHPEACTASTATPLADVTQGSTNACSSYAFAQAYTLAYALQHTATPVPQLSAVYAYYLQRVEECSTTGACPCASCVKPAFCFR